MSEDLVVNVEEYPKFPCLITCLIKVIKYRLLCIVMCMHTQHQIVVI